MVSNNPLTLTLLFMAMVHQGVRVCSSAPNKIANIRSSFQKWTFCTRTKLLEISRFHRNLGKFATFWDTLESCKCKRIDAPRLRGPRPPQFCGKYSVGIHSISSYLIGRFLFVFCKWLQLSLVATATDFVLLLLWSERANKFRALSKFNFTDVFFKSHFKNSMILFGKHVFLKTDF